MGALNLSLGGLQTISPILMFLFVLPRMNTPYPEFNVPLTTLPPFLPLVLVIIIDGTNLYLFFTSFSPAISEMFFNWWPFCHCENFHH